MILLLRNPVDRANSGYWQSVRKGRETLPIEEAMKKYMEAPFSYVKIKREDTGNNSLIINYVTGGVYVDAIKNFFEVFPKKQFLILRSEDFFANPEVPLKQVTDFLNLPTWKLKNQKKYNFHEKQPKFSGDLRKSLIEYYRPHNERLCKLLNMEFDWDI